MLANLIERAARLYPFSSGAGQFANSSLFRLIDPDGGPDRVVEVVGGEARVPSGEYVARAMRFVGDLDPKVSWIVDRSLNPGDVALDVGANLGLVSLRMAARVGTSGQVHAFEPQPKLIGYLEKTKALNPGCPLTVHPVALGAEDTELVLRIPDRNFGSASLKTTRASENGVKEVMVPVRRLDSYAEEIGLTRVDFIKMDVEGFEASVIEGAARLLERAPPHVIILEEHSFEIATGLPPSLQALEDLGYTLFALPRQFFSVRLFPLEKERFGHDFVAVSATAPERIRRALGLG